MRILTYVKSSPEKGLIYKKHENVHVFGYPDSVYVGDNGDKKFTTGYLTFIEENLVTWRNKKQDVSRSSAEAEYKAMVYTACEMMWLKNLLLELEFRQLELMPMFL